MSEDNIKNKIKEILAEIQDSINETPKRMFKYNKITFNLIFLKNRIKSVPETMSEVYEDEFILNQIKELEEGK